MKMVFKIFLFISSILVSGSCAVNNSSAGQKIIVTPLSDKITLSDGALVYGLPQTVIDIIVETERVIERPGPYARYAGDLLGLTDIISTESEHWSVKSITLKSHEELDPSEFYVIESNTLFQTNVLSLKKAGLILDLNPDVLPHEENNFQGKDYNIDATRILDLGADEYFLSQRDTAYRMVNVDTAFIKIPYLVEKKRKLTIDQLAEKAAVRLMEMREGKHLILTGEATVFPQNDAAIREMNRLEQEYTELFAGKTFTETKTFRYQIIPRKEMTGKQIPVFMFSETTGPSATPGGTGKTVTATFIPEQKTKELSLIPTKAEPQKKGYDNLYYRVPDVAILKISVDDDVLTSSRMLVYQLGQVIHLPANYIIGK